MLNSGPAREKIQGRFVKFTTRYTGPGDYDQNSSRKFTQDSIFSITPSTVTQKNFMGPKITNFVIDVRKSDTNHESCPLMNHLNFNLFLHEYLKQFSLQ